MSASMTEGGVRRKQLLSLAAAVALILAVTTFIAAFSIHKLSEVARETHLKTTAYAELADKARVAQVAFKTQVQEWKNLLLRGHSADDFEKFSVAFKGHQGDVVRRLSDLIDQTEQLSLDPSKVRMLKDQLGSLNAGYADALKEFNGEDPLSARMVDAAVRGRDRPVTIAFDEVVADVQMLAYRSVAASSEELVGWSSSLQRVIFVTAAIGILVLGLIVLLMLTARSGRSGN